MLDYLRAHLTRKSWHAIKNQIRELNGIPDNSPPLQFPRTSQIEGGLRELRCHSGSDLYRILYRRSGNLFVLLHVIPKTNPAIPSGDIELAQRRWRDYKQRMDAPDRRGPRPVGKDAP
ncbi:MAG TPA: type II toxin-antitoxin system RelE/ParE family toxin [Solirubrobacterales bacterium]|nr:type II toxin-antitoxin system RelE/ParE family toxin [Solirubrobacterales bacterium]